MGVIYRLEDYRRRPSLASAAITAAFLPLTLAGEAMNFWLDLYFPRNVPLRRLGRLGGDPDFRPPPPDRLEQVSDGIAPTTEHSAIEPWWYRL